MDETRAERLRLQLMMDHDAEPNKLTELVEELSALQEATGNPQELVDKYRQLSGGMLDFLNRLHNLALTEAAGSGGFVNFDESTLSQILLSCIRGYPDYRCAFEGTNNLLNEEMERSRALEQEISDMLSS